MPLSRSELIGADLRILVTLTARGKAHRYSTQDTEVLNGTDPLLPNPLHFLGGLEPIEYEDGIALGDGLAPPREASFSVLFRNDDGDGWASIAAADADLGDAVAEVALWRVGDDWIDRRVLLSGQVLAPEYGAAQEPVSMSITEEPGEDTARLLHTSSIVNDDTWTDPSGYEIYNETAMGQAYPILWGAPGCRFDIGAGVRLPAFPAFVTSMNILQKDNATTPCTVLIAGHHTAAGSSTSNTVRLFNKSTGGTSAAISVSNSNDDLGQLITSVTVPSTTLPIFQDDELYGYFESSATGGFIDHRHGGTLRNAADVLLDLLGRSNIRHDAVRINAIRHKLERFNFDFMINDEAGPWSIIEDQILPLLPLASCLGSNGLYFKYWPFDATTENAIAAIDTTSAGAWRTSSVKVSSVNDVFNRHTINYALNIETGEHSRQLVIAPRKMAAADTISTNWQTNPYSYASFTRYGLRDASEIDSDIIYDPSTAQAVLDWRIRRDGMTYRTVSYDMPQEFQFLEPGDVVTLTDNEIAFSSSICLVLSVLRRAGDTSITFRTIPNWIRDSPT